MGVITAVTWSEIAIGAADSGTHSHRVKLHGGGTNSSVQVFANGTDYPGSPSWHRMASPIPSVSLGGVNFVFAFWSVKMTKQGTHDSFTTIEPGPDANVSVNPDDDGATYLGEAKAYYVWTPGGGPGGIGGPYVLIDAFDSVLNDFIPDDPFVEVSTASDPSGTTFTPDPYPTNPLSSGANDLGYLDTSGGFPQEIKITAMDLPGSMFGQAKPFSYWMQVDAAGTPMPSIGATNPHDILVYHGNWVVAFAVYIETTSSSRTPKFEEEVLKLEVELPPKLDETVSDPAIGDPAWLKAVSQINDQLSGIAQGVAAQQSKTDTLATRLDTFEQQLGQAFIRLNERPAVGQQVAAAPRRGFFARLFGRG